jgi:hypothetical protein
MVLARVRAGDEVLAAILEVAERPAVLQRQPRHAQLLGLHDALVAEAAADVRRDHSHLLLVQAEEARDADAHDVRRLRRGIEDELVRAVVPHRQRRLAFHRHHRLARKIDAALHHHVGALGSFLEAVVEIQRQEQVVVPFFMDAHLLVKASGVRVDKSG